jgi:hypothetical protein
MVNKNKSADSYCIEGQENEYIDQRTQYDAMETDWSRHVTNGTNGGMIPVKVVEQIMVENEQLRQTIYANQSYHHSAVLNQLYQNFGHSTSQIIKTADQIEQYTKGVMKAQDCFRFIYQAIEHNFSLGFDLRRKGESKLQYGWRIGLLPIISMYMSALHSVVMTTFRADMHDARKFFEELKKKTEVKQKTKYKLNKARP